MSTLEIVIGIAVVVVIGLYIFIKDRIKPSNGGEKDKDKLREMVNEIIPDGQSYGMVYGSNWKKRGHTVYYYYYCIAFKAGIIHIIPISYDDGQITHNEITTLTKDNIYRIDTDGSTTTKFYDENNKKFLAYMVYEAVWGMSDMSCPFNFTQEEEAKEYYTFIKEFAASLPVNVK